MANQTNKTVDETLSQHNAVLKHLWGENIWLTERVDHLEQVLANLGFIALEDTDATGDAADN